MSDHAEENVNLRVSYDNKGFKDDHPPGVYVISDQSKGSEYSAIPLHFQKYEN